MLPPSPPRPWMLHLPSICCHRSGGWKRNAWRGRLCADWIQIYTRQRQIIEVYECTWYYLRPLATKCKCISFQWSKKRATQRRQSGSRSKYINHERKSWKYIPPLLLIADFQLQYPEGDWRRHIHCAKKRFGVFHSPPNRQDQSKFHWWNLSTAGQGEQNHISRPQMKIRRQNLKVLA